VIGSAAADSLSGDGSGFVIGSTRLEGFGHLVDPRAHGLHLLFEPMQLVFDLIRSFGKKRHPGKATSRTRWVLSGTTLCSQVGLNFASASTPPWERKQGERLMATRTPSDSAAVESALADLKRAAAGPGQPDATDCRCRPRHPGRDDPRQQSMEGSVFAP
jgi:hypothetical protein